ncbi:MarR family transcriptional regulator [Tissierella sp. MSJ-40]|uniref:MarR family transcriptional regulator n=1 Tax=Tissierella simiarum TaxID=2841534 RepID=A0ABS6E354_9FIRM|nr:MarR family transcriptional regulator [Tissierella simiarum]MBU5437332.1 MarR family transcriptional regulator [Tissierella simiarum]
MRLDKNESLEEIFFTYLDQFKFLFFPDQWSEIFLDHSKNEILSLLFLYRYKVANMTEISEYINAPLNTTTGVIDRLEKKEMVERIRSSQDRRVVQISLTSKAKDVIAKEKEIIEYYFRKIYKSLTEDEKKVATSIFKKVIEVLYKENKIDNEKDIKKIKKIEIE